MGTDISTDVQAQLKARQQRLAAKLEGLSEGGEPNAIKAQGQHFILPDGETKIPMPLKVVVLGFAYFNAYYKTKYVQGQASFPDCFAVGDHIPSMQPSQNSPDAQHENCLTCPHNQFGSAENGRGKACGNRMNLAVQLPEFGGAEGPIYRISVSPTALTGWKQLVDKLSSRGVDPIQLVIEIGRDPNVDYMKYTFSAVSKVDPDELGAYLNNADEAERMIMSEPKPPSDE